MNRSDVNHRAKAPGTWLAPLLLVAGLAAAPLTPAAAQQAGLVKDTGAAQRIDLVERVRAISQKIGAAACYSNAGIESAAFNTVMTDSITEFDRIMAALSDGSPDLGLPGKEEERKVLAGIRGVNLQWAEFSKAAQALLADSSSADSWAYVARQNLNLMHSTKYLVGEVMNTYANPPELLQSNALTLDIVGRQRALAFQLSKESCGLLTGNTVVGNPERLSKTMRLFEASLNALRNGFDAAGVIKPPTDEIKTGLEAVAADWDGVKTELAKVTGPDSVDAAASLDIFTRLDAISAKFDALTVLYVASSKSGI
jgi:Type IV pili methyl-accepting chemotaxis transducer N-term